MNEISLRSLPIIAVLTGTTNTVILTVTMPDMVSASISLVKAFFFETFKTCEDDNSCAFNESFRKKSEPVTNVPTDL